MIEALKFSNNWACFKLYKQKDKIHFFNKIVSIYLKNI